MTKAQAGQIGGLTTYRKYGTRHMREIGKRGAAAFWDKYFLSPVGVSNFAIVCRKTNKVIGFTNSTQWR